MVLYSKAIASPTHTISWTGGTPISSTANVVTPTGRAMANGSKAVLIVALAGYMAGHGASRSVRMRLGSATTGWFTVGAGSSAVSTGVRSSSYYLVAGGSVPFSYDTNGATYFGRGGSGTITVGGVPSGTWTGTLAGTMYYVQAPTAPSGITLSSDSAQSVTASWSAPSTDGGSSITGYRLQYSTASNFAGAVTVELGSGRSYTVEDLDDGQTYYFRVAAKNYVTTLASTTSVYSAAASISVASSGTLIAGIAPEFTENPGAFWSLAGHNVGFNKTGDLVHLDEAAVTFEYYDNVTAQDVQVTTVVRRNAAWATTYNVIAEQMYAQHVLGDSLLGIIRPDGISSTQMIAFKTNLNEGSTKIEWQGRPVDSNVGTGQVVTVTADAATGNFTIAAEYRAGGFVSTASSVLDISGLDLTKELSIYLTYSWDTNTREYTLYSSIRESDSYTSSIGNTLTYIADGVDLYTDPWEITGNARSLVTSNMMAGSVMNDLHEWENVPSYSISGDIPTDGPVIAYNGNVWDYIQMIASGTGCEFAPVGNNIVVRPLGTRVLDITNIVGSPTISPQSLFTGRIVRINYSNAEPVNLGVIYDAALESNKTFTIDANEIKIEAISINASPQSVLQPSPTGTYPNPAGTYYITDSQDEVVSPVDWVDYGGSVSVSIDTEATNVINITLTGPSVEIPNSPAPYTIGTKISSIPTGTLKIIGSGLLTNPKHLDLLTGADPDKTPQLIATTIDNPAITTLATAYDRGIWASLLATMRMTLSGTVPLSAIDGFGLTAGSLVQYADNIYRVVDASIGNLGVSFTAEVHCTVNDYSARWAEQTVADHDAHWAGYDAHDERIIPLR